MLLHAGVIAIPVYAVLDLEYPRFGFRLDAADRALDQLRDSIRQGRRIQFDQIDATDQNPSK